VKDYKDMGTILRNKNGITAEINCRIGLRANRRYCGHKDVLEFRNVENESNGKHIESCA
jgi:hypothetical protein